MTSLLWLALATFVVVQANVLPRNRDLYLWEEQDEAMSRAVRSAYGKDLDSWLTEEQKKVLKPIMHDSAAFKKKVMEFWETLPKDEQVKWTPKYRTECTKWVKESQSPEAEQELIDLYKTDADAAQKKYEGYLDKLPEEHREKASVWKSECSKLLSGSRTKRNLDPNLSDFTNWLTDDQKKEIEEMKTSGKSIAEIRDKSKEYFEALPTDKQASLTEELKGKCKGYFTKIATTEEMADVKALYDSGMKSEIPAKISTIIDRQPEDVKTTATKVQTICTEVFSHSSKRRRDINQKIEKHLSWLSQDQKDQISKMHADGKSNQEIRTTILSWLNKLGDDAKKNTKSDIQKECYKWLEQAASKDEIAELHKLHETDHNACKTKVREYIKRLDPQIEVEKNLAFCENVWYGDHSSHGSHDHGSHGHHHRKRRHLEAIEKYIDWLTPEQKNELEELEKSGTDFDVILVKVKEFFRAEGSDKQEDLKAKFKEHCLSWVKEVASPEEHAQAKEWKEDREFDKLKELLAQLESRLSEDKKHTVEHVRDVCFKLWDVPLARRRRAEPIPDDVFGKYLSWITDEQKAELESIKKTGDREAFYKNIMGYFSKTTGETRTKAGEELKAGCKHYANHFFGDEKLAEIKKLKESGSSVDEIYQKMKGFADELTDEDKKTRAIKLVEGCKMIFMAKPVRRRRDEEHNAEDMISKYLSWTTDEQKDTVRDLLKENKREEIYTKIMQWFGEVSEDKKAQASAELLGACKHFGRHLLGDENADKIKALKESGTPVDEIKAKVKEMIAGLSDETKKAKAAKLTAGCEKIYAEAKSRKRRGEDHNIDEILSKYLTWLSADQTEAVKELFKDNKREEIYTKIMEYFDATSGDTRKTAANELLGACKHFGRHLLGDENADKVKAMKDAGDSMDDIKAKVKEMIAGITDETKKAKATKLTVGCEKIYGAIRSRRDHHHHRLDEAFKRYLTWTTQDQKDALRALEKEGNKEEIYKKIMEYFEATEGETRQTAVEELKAGCKKMGAEIFGEDKYDTLKKLKDGGASADEMKNKALGLVEEIEDAEKKAKAAKLVTGCGKIFAESVKSRRRRDHHHHKLDDAFTKYLTWTTQDQKDDLKALEAQGQKDEVYKKIMEYFDATTGETRTTAVKEMQEGCRHFGADIFGADKYAELKTMKDNGATGEELKKKALELVDELTDEAKKEKAQKLVAGCEKVFASTAVAVSRRRRGLDHNLESAFAKWLTWTTQEQKDELKALEAAGDEEGIHKKIMEYFAATTGDTRNTATEEMKSACKYYGEVIFGEEKVAALKKLRESGATNEELKKEVLEQVNEITDPKNKAKATKLVEGCEKVYAGTVARRRRGGDHNVDEVLSKYLTWLSADQISTVKELFKDNKREEIYTKVMEWYEGTSGDTRKVASQELLGACKHFGRHLLGDENADKIKAMKESGTSVDEIKSKVKAMVDELADPVKKAKAMKLTSGCEKIYAAQAVRRRRDQEHNAEDVISKYLKWTTDEQKETVRELFKNNKREEIYTKIIVWFEALGADEKKKAGEELLGACKHFGRHLLGDENADKIKAMKDSGTPVDEIKAKVKEMIAGLSDETKKAKAAKLTAGCEKIYAGTVSRRRRDHHDVDEFLSKYLTWLNEDQTATVKELYKDGKKGEIYTKVMEWYQGVSEDKKDVATNELKGACKHIGRHYLGNENADKIKALKESGASMDDIKAKVKEMIAGLSDETTKAKATKLQSGCEKIFSAASRKRRDQDHKIDDIITKYMSWMTLEQKDSVKDLFNNDKREEIYTKVLEYYEATTGETRKAAASELLGACKHFGRDLLGNENADTIKTLRESGASIDEIKLKLKEMVGSLTDDVKKAKAVKLIAGCEKVYAVAETPSRKRRGHNLDEALEKYLSWTTEEQRNELKELKAQGNKKAILGKIQEYFEAAKGDAKTTAVKELKDACKDYSVHFFGQEKVDEIKGMYESGTPKEEIHEKVTALIAELPENRQEKAKGIVDGCKMVYKAAEARLKRRIDRIRRRTDKHEVGIRGDDDLLF